MSKIIIPTYANWPTDLPVPDVAFYSEHIINKGLSGTKSLPKPTLTNHQWGLVYLPLSSFAKMRKIYILDISLQINYLKLQLHLLGANKVMKRYCMYGAVDTE